VQVSLTVRLRFNCDTGAAPGQGRGPGVSPVRIRSGEFYMMEPHQLMIGCLWPSPSNIASPSSKGFIRGSKMVVGLRGVVANQRRRFAD
jgi:hypothetical protein